MLTVPVEVSTIVSIGGNTSILLYIDLLFIFFVFFFLCLFSYVSIDHFNTQVNFKSNANIKCNNYIVIVYLNFVKWLHHTIAMQLCNVHSLNWFEICYFSPCPMMHHKNFLWLFEIITKKLLSILFEFCALANGNRNEKLFDLSSVDDAIYSNFFYLLWCW